MNVIDDNGGARDWLGVENFLRTARPLWPWLCAIASGLMMSACFAPLDQAWLCWIALTPLIAAVWFSGKNSRRFWLRNLLLGYITGIVFFTFTFGWLGALGDLYQSFFLHGLSFLLSIYLALHFAFWAWVIGLIKPAMFVSSWRNALAACLAAAAWVTHEWIRGWLFSGFGWNGLGVALHGNWALIQIAAFTGVIGLSFAIVFANVIAVTTALRLFFEARDHRMQPHFDLTLTLIGIVGLFAFGAHVALPSAAVAKSVRIGAVQASIPQFQKFDPQSAREIFERFQRLSEIALRSGSPPDLLVWPESALPEPVRDQNSESHRFVANFLATAKTDLLLGTLDVENDREYNAALLVSNGGARTQIYRKIHLVPFGEYIPARKAFPLFAAIASAWVPGDLTPGSTYDVFNLTNRDVRIAPLICFEDTVGDLVRRFVGHGANLLVDVTNDGWFLHSCGSRQHLANAIFRCVENRRPMVRAANTGVTCFVNEFGRVTQILQDDTGNTFSEGVLTGEINVPLARVSPSGGGQDRELTFYTRHGDVFAMACTGVSLVVIFFKFMQRRRGRDGSPEPPAGD